MKKYKVAIIGATGYTGSELVRILVHHPQVELVAITSESRAGEPFSAVHPFFRGIVEMPLKTAAEASEMELDLVFLALPHGVSMSFVPQFEAKGIKIVDLSGDYRLSSPEVYTEWYNKEHTHTSAFAQAAYGLPEFYAEKIKNAPLVANPGCYPTTSLLAIAPLLAENLVEPSPIIIDAKSGTTGAGVKASATTHFSNVNDNFKAYGIMTHRHSIEIQENSETLSGNAAKIQFTPHLLPVDRGILATCYLRPNSSFSEEKMKAAYENFYAGKPFVRLCNTAPAIKDVRGTNYCDIFTTFDARTENIIVVSVIDNLVKGAAGQAVQNMNLMFGFDETAGLGQVPVQP